MTCRDAADFMLDYLAGELPDAARETFERHLAQCRNCVQYLLQYRATIALERSAFDDDLEPAIAAGVPEELVAAILAARRHM